MCGRGIEKREKNNLMCHGTCSRSHPHESIVVILKNIPKRRRGYHKKYISSKNHRSVLIGERMHIEIRRHRHNQCGYLDVNLNERPGPWAASDGGLDDGRGWLVVVYKSIFTVSLVYSERKEGRLGATHAWPAADNQHWWRAASPCILHFKFVDESPSSTQRQPLFFFLCVYRLLRNKPTCRQTSYFPNSLNDKHFFGGGFSKKINRRPPIPRTLPRWWQPRYFSNPWQYPKTEPVFQCLNRCTSMK